MTGFAFSFSNCKLGLRTESKDVSSHHLKHCHPARHLAKPAVCMEPGMPGVWGTGHECTGCMSWVCSMLSVSVQGACCAHAGCTPSGVNSVVGMLPEPKSLRLSQQFRVTVPETMVRQCMHLAAAGNPLCSFF